MSGYSGYIHEQIHRLVQENDSLRVDIEIIGRLLDRVRAICKEHEGCECSAALQIMEVLRG